MKRLTTAILALCIIFFVSCASAEDKLFSFLDIPFGISMEECKAILTEKAKTLFPEGTGDHVKIRKAYMYLGNGMEDPFLFHGYPSYAEFHFSSEGESLEEINVILDVEPGIIPEEPSERRAFFRARAEVFIAVQEELERMFGAPDTGELSAGDKVTARSSDMKKYRYPVIDGKLDENVLYEAYSQHNYVFTLTIHGNVEVMCYDITSYAVRGMSFHITYRPSKPSVLELAAEKVLTLSYPPYPMP